MANENPGSTALSNSRFEKDPDICLVYKLFGLNGAELTKHDTACEVPSAQTSKELLKKFAQPSGIKICADGDSWINILIEISHLFGYQKTFFDVLEGHYKSASTAWPGDTFDQMLQEKTFKVHIDSGIFDYFIFSGGGNDILGGGALKKLLKRKSEGGGSSDPERYLSLDGVDSALQKLRSGYLEIAQYVKVRSPKTQMLVHGYDYPVARANGPWLGKPFIQHQFDLQQDSALIARIFKHLVDGFYGMLDDIAQSNSNVTVINLRNAVKGRWTDELHPTREASEDIASIYRGVMKAPPIV